MEESKHRLMAVIWCLDDKSPCANGRELVLAGSIEIKQGGQWHV